MRMRLATVCVVSLALSLAVESALAEQEGAQESLDIGSRLELFVDDYLIDSMTGEVDLKLHTPSSSASTRAGSWTSTSPGRVPPVSMYRWSTGRGCIGCTTEATACPRR